MLFRSLRVIESRWGWGCTRWCYALRLRRRPPRAVRASPIPFNFSRRHTGVVASSSRVRPFGHAPDTGGVGAPCGLGCALVSDYVDGAVSWLGLRCHVRWILVCDCSAWVVMSFSSINCLRVFLGVTLSLCCRCAFLLLFLFSCTPCKLWFI